MSHFLYSFADELIKIANPPAPGIKPIKPIKPPQQPLQGPITMKDDLIKGEIGRVAGTALTDPRPWKTLHYGKRLAELKGAQSDVSISQERAAPSQGPRPPR